MPCPMSCLKYHSALKQLRVTRSYEGSEVMTLICGLLQWEEEGGTGVCGYVHERLCDKAFQQLQSTAGWPRFQRGRHISSELGL